MAFEKPQRPIDRVFVHCSASDRLEHDDIEVIRDWHVNGHGWSDIGYHYFIKKDGTIEPGRDLEWTPAAQKGNNIGTIAICLHGLAVEKFSRPQFRSVIELCEEINSAYQGTVSFHGHREVSSKSCPVFSYSEVLGLDDHGSMDFAPTLTPEIPIPLDADRPTLRLMDTGPAVLEIQNLLAAQGFETAADGAFGQLTLAAVKQFQEGKMLNVDGIVGRKTWELLAA